jgi:hypothetical protein
VHAHDRAPAIATTIASAAVSSRRAEAAVDGLLISRRCTGSVSLARGRREIPHRQDDDDRAPILVATPSEIFPVRA